MEAGREMGMELLSQTARFKHWQNVVETNTAKPTLVMSYGCVSVACKRKEGMLRRVEVYKDNLAHPERAKRQQDLV